MACAYAKWTGKLGVCLATRPRRHASADRALRRQARPGAGAGHHRHAVPRPGRDLHPAGRGLTRAFGDVAVFNAQVTDAAHMEAWPAWPAVALAGRGVAHICDRQRRAGAGEDEAERSKRNRPAPCAGPVVRGQQAAGRRGTRQGGAKC